MHLLFLFCISIQVLYVLFITARFLFFNNIIRLIDFSSNQLIRLLVILDFTQQKYLSNNFYIYCQYCSALGFIFQINYFNRNLRMFIAPNLLLGITISDEALLKSNLLLHFDLLS